MTDEKAGDNGQPSQERVSLDKASDLDISAFLQAARGQERGNKDDEDDDGPNHYYQENEDEGDAKVNDSEPVPTQPEAPKPDISAQAEIERLTKKNEQLASAIQKQNAYVQRRSTEIGELRKQIEFYQAKLSEGLEDKFVEDPNAAIDAKLQLRANQQALAQLNEEERELHATSDAFRMVAAHVPPEEFDVTAMAEALARDGIGQESVAEFAKNPFAFSDGPTLIQLAKRTYAESVARKLWKHVHELHGQMDALQKKPEKILNGIQNATSQKPMTAASGQSVGTGKVSAGSFDVSRMSDAEIDEFLKRARQRG